MNINFRTKAKFDNLTLDTLTDKEREVSQRDGLRASEIVWSVHHYLFLLECEHYIDHMGITFRAKNLNPLQCNILFQIGIKWGIFDDKQAEILLEWDADKKKLYFREFKRDKNLKNEPQEEPPVKEIKIKDRELMAICVAAGLIQAIDLTIRDISKDAKDRAMRLGFRSDKLSRISEYL